ncbi:MAG: Calx-beta domain-containing protein [Pirellulaceae bacterium]
MFEQLEDKSLLSTVGVMAPSSHVPEGNGAIVYISVNPPTYTTVTASYQTNAGTAIEDTDYDGVSGSVTIYPGQPYVGISIPVYNDFSFDPGETFSITLTGATGATVDPANSSTTITIDDVPPPAGSGTLWITPTVSHNEGTNQGALTEYKFNVVFSGNIPGGFVAEYHIRPKGAPNSQGYATPDKDYVAQSAGNLAFTGTTGQTLEIIVNGKKDDRVEFDESFEVVIDSVHTGSGMPVNVTHSAIGTGVIVNDDFADLRYLDFQQLEDDPPAAGRFIPLDISLKVSAFEKDVVVSYKFTPVDATLGSDYTAATGVLTVTIPAEQFWPTAYPTATVIPDIVTEPNETLKMEIVGVAFADGSEFPGIRNYERIALDVVTSTTTITADHFAIGTIIDDDQKLITVTTPIVAPPPLEGNGGAATTVTVNVNYMGKTPAANPFYVLVDAVSGSATFVEDFDFVTWGWFDGLPANTRAVYFAGTVGETHPVVMEFVGDTTVEINETFTVVASSIYQPPNTGNSGVSIDMTANSAAITITNDDTARVSIDYLIVPHWEVWEGDGVDDPVGSISLELSNEVDVPVYVEFTIAGSGASPATIPAITVTGLAPAVRGTDDISALPNAQWSTLTSSFWVTIPANTTTGKIDIQVLSDGVVEAHETLTVTLVGIGEVPPAAGRAGNLVVSPTDFAGQLKIKNDD